MQPIKELSSAAGRCAGRGCALIRQLANSNIQVIYFFFDTFMLVVDAGCGRTLQESQGTFGSPDTAMRATVGGDDSWPHSELCQWRIQATHGEKIVLNVTMLDLPDSVDCATSYVEVRDGPSIKSPLIGQ